MQTVEIGDIIKFNGKMLIVTQVNEYRKFGAIDRYGMRYLVDNDNKFKILRKSQGWLTALGELEI